MCPAQREIINHDFKIRDLNELYMIDKMSNCSPKTVTNYQQHLSYFFDFMESEWNTNSVIINKIKLMDLNKYTLYLKNKNKYADHPINPMQEKKLSNTTVRDYCVSVKVLLNWCYLNEYIEFDISKNWKLPRIDKREVLPLYQDEVDKIETLYSRKCDTHFRNLAIIHCGLDAGLRSSDIIGLDLCDVDFQKNYIHIKGDNSKGYRERYIKLSQKLKGYLLQYKLVFRNPNQDPHAPFFFNIKSGERITIDGLKCMIRNIKKHTGITRIKFHLFRHTFASSFMLGGGNISSLQTLLGHSTIQMTEKYVHMSNQYISLGEDIYRLEKSFFTIYYGKNQY